MTEKELTKEQMRMTLTSSVNDETEEFFKAKGTAKKGNRASIRGSIVDLLASESHGLTVNAAVFAVLSTCVGGGLVSLPLSMWNLGIPISVVLQIAVMFLTHLGTNFFLYIIEIIPSHPDNLYEIGYILFGRCSIFFLSSMICINTIGICMIYFIVFGDTAGQLAASFTDGETLGSVWYTSRWCYSVPLAFAAFPFCLKKDLAEFAWVAYLLFTCIAIFLFANAWQLCFDPHFTAEGMTVEILEPKMDWSIISSLSAIMVAFGYQQNAFPIWAELRPQTTESYQ